jgi:hypothetical protein
MITKSVLCVTVNIDKYYDCYTNGDIAYKYELHNFPVFSKISDYIMAVHTTKYVCMYVCVYRCDMFPHFNKLSSGYTHFV